MFLHFWPILKGIWRQSNELFFWLKLLLETRRSAASIESLIDILACLQPKLWPKKNILPHNQKIAENALSLTLATGAMVITRRYNMIASWFEPSKHLWSLVVCTEKKTFEISVWGFRWVSLDWGNVLRFLVILLWLHRPDNEPKLWLKLWLYSGLEYEALEA